MTKEQLFWDWFQKNEIRFFNIDELDDDEQEFLLDDLLFHLHKYCDQLFFEIGGDIEDKQDLIITAEGNIDFFDEVEALVAQAPFLQNWNIIAFKPAVDEGVIEYEGVKIDPELSYFTPLTNESSQKVGLRLYVENYDRSHQKDFLFVAYLTLDNILGEKSNALNVGYVEIEALPDISQREELLELVELPRYVAWKKSKGAN